MEKIVRLFKKEKMEKIVDLSALNVNHLISQEKKILSELEGALKKDLDETRKEFHDKLQTRETEIIIHYQPQIEETRNIILRLENHLKEGKDGAVNTGSEETGMERADDSSDDVVTF